MDEDEFVKKENTERAILQILNRTGYGMIATGIQTALSLEITDNPSFNIEETLEEMKIKELVNYKLTPIAFGCTTKEKHWHIIEKGKIELSKMQKGRIQPS